MKLTQLDFQSVETALGQKLIANGKASQALHETVVAYQANRRSGTRGTLTKATVDLSGSKPWRQKGTGRARAGYASSPVWRGGGVVFGPQPHDYSKKVSKRTKKVALKKAVSELAKNGRIHSADSLEIASGKSKDLVKLVKDAGISTSLLIVTKAVDPKLVLASRNVSKIDVLDVNQVNAEDLIRHDKVLIVNEALSALGKRLE